MTGKNIWRLCKVYGRLIGCPTLKPHDLRHGVAMEVLEQHHDLEEVRALLGHARIDTTQVYASIRPPLYRTRFPGHSRMLKNSVRGNSR
jgi:integrase/recombinase XerD